MLLKYGNIKIWSKNQKNTTAQIKALKNNQKDGGLNGRLRSNGKSKREYKTATLGRCQMVQLYLLY